MTEEKYQQILEALYVEATSCCNRALAAIENSDWPMYDVWHARMQQTYDNIQTIITVFRSDVL